MTAGLTVPVHLLITMTGEQVAEFAAEHGLDPTDTTEIRQRITETVHTDSQQGTSGVFWTVELRSARKTGGV